MLLRHLTLLVIIPALLGGHLRREHTGCDGVNPNLDPVLRNLRREQLVEVYRSAFAGVVCKVALRNLDVTGDGGDVDDGTGVAGVCLGGLLEQRQEGCGHEEGADDVGLVDV